MDDFILELRGIGKSFGETKVLSGIDFKLRKGSVHAVCGENGAGKSTLMKILSGVHSPDAGRMFLEGKSYSPKNPAEALQKGISMIYQELDLAEDLTVAENVFLGNELYSKRCPFKLDNAEMLRITDKLIREYGFQIRADAKISELSVGEAQIVELLKALRRKSKIIVMDEPTSALSEKEALILFGIIRKLAAEGISILYISHRMEEIRELSDTVSVLRDGEMILTSPTDRITVDEIIKAMVGRELHDFYPKRNVKPGEIVFSAENLSDHENVHGVSFQVRAGEIVGVAGLVGAGRTETADVIFGVTGKVSGKIMMDGRELDIRTPADAIHERIAYLTEDRKRTGLCVNLPCFWNITFPNFERLGMNFVICPSAEKEKASERAGEVRIKWSDPEESADHLSGGNQQKLLLARWLMAESRFLIFDEPTRGIDIGAKKEVYTLLNSLAEQGRAILLISSELPEIFGVCDRILVMREGKIKADLVTAETTPEEVMKFASGSMN